MGDRPNEVSTAIASIREQSVAAHEIILVGNGTTVSEADDVTTLNLPDNVGVTGGRNAGAQVARGDVLFFLDDDARLIGSDVACDVLRLLDDRPEVAAVSLRIVDETSGQVQRRHVPRLRVGDPLLSSDVTTFLGGACAIRRNAFEQAGGYPEAFFYAMEETDLAWGLLDLGHTIHYLGSSAVHHPTTQPARHGFAFSATARNRVWLARRRLPRPMSWIYIMTSLVLTLVRAPSWQARKDIFGGTLTGVQTRPDLPSRPISWATIWRMTRLGRPPVV